MGNQHCEKKCTIQPTTVDSTMEDAKQLMSQRPFSPHSNIPKWTQYWLNILVLNLWRASIKSNAVNFVERSAIFLSRTHDSASVLPFVCNLGGLDD